jgi:hypothetical protein
MGHRFKQNVGVWGDRRQGKMSEYIIPNNKELPWCLLRDHFFSFVCVYAVEWDDDDDHFFLSCVCML